MLEKIYVAQEAINNNVNKRLLGKNPSLDYSGAIGWEYDVMDWHTMYLGLFLIDTFKIDKNQCIDIGGFKGFFSSVYSRHFKEVHTFEPNPYAYITAKLSFKRQELPNVTLHKIPLFEEEKETNFYLNFYDTDKKFVAAQSNLEKKPKNSNFYTEVIKVKTRTLDSFSFKPSFIKIDVEGFGLEVINGGWNTITTYKPFIQIENDIVLENNDVIENLLKDIGYKKIDTKDYLHVYNGNWDLTDSYFLHNG